MNKFLIAQSYTLKGEYVSILRCWIPQDKIELLKKKLEDAGYSRKVMLIVEEPEKHEEVPVLIKRSRVVPSWQSLFAQMGYPSQEDIFPWWLAGFLWAFMFGFMFPDIGQGIAIILMGIIFSTRKEVLGFSGKKIGNLLITAGISATLFGILYGEFFLVEIYPPLMPGLVEHWLHVRASVSWVIKYALVIGIVEIILACILFMYRNAKMGHYSEIIFGEWGIPGLLMYIGLVLCGLYFIGVTLLPPFKIFGYEVRLVFEEKRMAILNLKNVHDSWPMYIFLSGMALLIIGGKIEGNLGDKAPALIELPLSMIANTLSFTRLAGFLIGHAAFALVVETFGGGSITNVMLWAMNALVLTLELLVVSLQALRLIFYEFATKWYAGGGRIFRPFKL